ncbi:MAG: polyprenyl synthetase family protein [Chromatiaceae bacterium]|nr:polyprenyl synthetase family protein [Chromatiaceae bacterium]
MSDTQLTPFLAACSQRIEAALETWLPPEQTPPAKLHRAMRYAILGGGKRIRPTLAYATAAAIGLAPEQVNGIACAVEMIHAYSLIHDDLPAMDDDDLRHGRPTCHKAFDEATAILAGDALMTQAFLVLARDGTLAVGAEARLAMIDRLAWAAGSRGMAGGQAMDLEAEGHEIDLIALENIHIHKTGALIRASVNMTSQAAPGLAPDLAERLDHYAKCLGLAFQIRDDILDIEAPTAILGKTHGKDQAQAKATYPALMGLGAARQAAADLVDEALASLEPFDAKADPLRWMAPYIVQRDR